MYSGMIREELKRIIKASIISILLEAKNRTVINKDKKTVFADESKAKLEKMKAGLMAKSKSYQDKKQKVPKEITDKISQINLALKAKTKAGTAKK
jgi:hypothetical protein